MNIMTSTNKAQLIAAIKAVPCDHNTPTEVTCINDEGKVLVRYKFITPKKHGEREHAARMNKIASNARKLPAIIWR